MPRFYYGSTHHQQLGWVCLCLMVLGSAMLGSASAATNQHQVYVVHTYGNPALASVVQAELNARSGGSATMHQDRLIIRATPSDYAHVSALISQIDTAPEALTVSVATAPSVHYSSHHNQVNVGIQSGVWINGRYQNQSISSHGNHAYSVHTLSGHDVSISQSTLVGLMTANTYQHGRHMWLNIGTTWLTLSDGFKATPRLLPSGQVAIRLHQSSRQGQQLDTTITAPRGQWVKVGEMSMTDQQTHAHSGYHHRQISQNMPVWIRVD